MSTRTLLRAVVGIVAASAFVSIWGGWVGLGQMAGFGEVNLLPGAPRDVVIDLAITLPLGIEAYAAIALYVAVGGLVTGAARVFAWCSAIGALGIGAVGQAVYHLLAAEEAKAAGRASAPTEIVVFVSVLPVAVLGLASVLLHLAERGMDAAERADPVQPVQDGGGTDDPDDGTPGTGSPEGWTERGTEVSPDGPWVPIDGEFPAALAGPVQSQAARVPPVQEVPGTHVWHGPGVQVEGDQDLARALICAALERGEDCTVQQLISRHGMGERWWRYRVGEVREEMADR